ncbi:MAG: hypothetical protein CO149_04455 [Nitrospirae bacterium CG_4_9_14_3_um_filter_51_5]|nr:MAG: hypothetical protein CO149_04455 [Nitrospirae bacterium CG_4_9_14_3_um_filter_51_5]
MYRRILNIALISSVIFFLWVHPVLAQGGAVWDEDLNRFLTQEELGHEEIYLTPEEAAQLMFSSSDRIRQEILTLSPQQKADIEQRIGWHFPETTFDCFIGETKGKTDGWAIIQHTIGKHKPMTYIVGVDPSGEVTNVEVLVFRESRGSEVRTKRFNYQYQGKTPYDPIRINRDIINISGATMSVRSMSAGVKRALVLVEELYLTPAGKGSAINTANLSDKGFFESLLGF